MEAIFSEIITRQPWVSKKGNVRKKKMCGMFPFQNAHSSLFIKILWARTH
jgi:hypothetical protein